MRESVIEAYLVKRVREAGGEAYKFSSPNRRNVPDRLVVFPKGVIFFVEVKATGEEPTPAQYREHKRLRDKGQAVTWGNSKAYMDVILRHYVK